MNSSLPVPTKVPSLREPLEAQIRALTSSFPNAPGIMRLYLFGSCARGEATYRSDVDLLAVQMEAPTFARVAAIRDFVEAAFAKSGMASVLSSPLPVQIQAIAEASEDRFTRESAPAILLRDFAVEA